MVRKKKYSLGGSKSTSELSTSHEASFSSEPATLDTSMSSSQDAAANTTASAASRTPSSSSVDEGCTSPDTDNSLSREPTVKGSVDSGIDTKTVPGHQEFPDIPPDYTDIGLKEGEVPNGKFSLSRNGVEDICVVMEDNDTLDKRVPYGRESSLNLDLAPGEDEGECGWFTGWWINHYNDVTVALSWHLRWWTDH